MPSKTVIDDENEKKKPKMDRITVGLDEFDYKVISKMAQNRNIPLSEATRIVVHSWIESNPEILKRNYGVNVEEITEEIALESAEISIDKRLQPYEEAIINELPQLFEMVDDVGLEDLADQFEVSVKAIKNIIFTHSNHIKKVGLNLKYKGDRIYKEWFVD